MTKCPTRVSSSPNFYIPDAPIDFHGSDLSLQGGSSLRQSFSIHEWKAFQKTFLTPVQLRQSEARKSISHLGFQGMPPCVIIWKKKKRAQHLSWGKQNSGFFQFGSVTGMEQVFLFSCCSFKDFTAEPKVIAGIFPSLKEDSSTITLADSHPGWWCL